MPGQKARAWWRLENRTPPIKQWESQPQRQINAAPSDRLGSTPIIESVGNSTYHAFQWSLGRRLRGGLTILTNYQFAKSMDDTSQNKATGGVRTNPNNQQFDKGLSDFHRAHVFNFSSLYELPFRPTNSVMRTLVGGSNVNGILSLNSGQPLTALSGVDNARTGAGNQRADIIGDPSLSGGRSHQDQYTEWLRRAAFAPNSLGTCGNLGRNTFFGPGNAARAGEILFQRRSV